MRPMTSLWSLKDCKPAGPGYFQHGVLGAEACVGSALMCVDGQWILSVSQDTLICHYATAPSEAPPG